VHLVRPVSNRLAGPEVVHHARIPGSGEEGGQPLVVLHHLVRHDTGRDPVRPPNHLGNAEGTLPVAVLLVPERRHTGVGPAVHVRPVVRRVHDDGVLSDSKLVEGVEQLPDVLVVVDHRVVVRRLPPSSLAQALRLGMRAEVHVRRVHPDEERGARVVLAPDEVDAGIGRLVVDGLHPLPGQRARVLDALFSPWPVPTVNGVVVLIGGPGVDHPTRPGQLVEAREVLGRWPVRRLGFLLGVEVVEVAEELVEPVHCRQELVLVP
jgi:hypothetical protein